MKENKKNYWYLSPTMIIDRSKYKGKGRPRKDDYRKFPSDQDFIPLKWELDIKDFKSIIGSRGKGSV